MSQVAEAVLEAVVFEADDNTSTHEVTMTPGERERSRAAARRRIEALREDAALRRALAEADLDDY